MAVADSRRMQLRDGRTLGYAEYGDPCGRPLIYCHGFPGSRLEASIADEAAQRQGIRLISIDRPGIGLSSFREKRTFADWPADVLELADALGLATFAVLGVSGGSPYAAACAARIPYRLTRVGIVAGISPLSAPEATLSMLPLGRLGLRLAGGSPLLGRIFYAGFCRLIHRDPRRFLEQMAESLPEIDRQVLARSEVQRVLVASAQAAVADGSRGGARELALYSRPWGFLLQEIPLEVILWHGGLDNTIPPAMGRFLAGSIPRCRPLFFPDEGHYSLPIDHMEEILGALVE